MTNDTTGTDSGPNRRRLLGMIGGSAGALVTGFGLAEASPENGNSEGNGDGNSGGIGKRNRDGNREGNSGENGEGNRSGVGPCTCGECPEETFCGKIDDPPEAGRTYRFSSHGSRYSVTIDSVTSKEDNEVTCFEFSSDDDIQKVCVGGGPDTKVYTGGELDENLCAPTTPGGQQSEISNISFCGREKEEMTYYQIDLAGGDVIKDFDSDEGRTYTKEGRLLEAFSISSSGDLTSGLVSDGEETITFENGETCTFSWENLEFDASDQTARADVTLEGGGGSNDACKITLAGYRLPDGETKFTPENIDDQEYITHETQILALSDASPTELSIDIDN